MLLHEATDRIVCRTRQLRGMGDDGNAVTEIAGPENVRPENN